MLEKHRERLRMLEKHRGRLKSTEATSKQVRESIKPQSKEFILQNKLKSELINYSCLLIKQDTICST